ncbi:MAG: sodium ion-translocating decarboxylase subunit beta [Firmicutes bacterium]|nr:sodium ion-translocating decarboxylase subunit beta [Bacillota bacterium]
MIVIGLGLIMLAIAKNTEPLLLLPIGFGCILCNIPLSHAVGADGFLKVLYDAGIATELFPVLLFIGIGAMIDFGPLFMQPVTLFFGAAAQLGIFVAMLLAVGSNFIFPEVFTMREAAAIGIIGAADGPSAIFIGQLFAPRYMGSIMVAAYSYMSLVPLIQPPVVRALTTSKERRIRMTASFEKHKIPKHVRILFPIVVTLVAGIVAPMSTSLIGALMFGNLIRECGVTEKLSQTAQNELSGLVTLLLGITIGSTMRAQDFLTPQTALIMGIGLLAFMFDTAGGVLFAKLANLFLPEDRKVNPMVGACGISAFPMSARVIQRMAQQEDPSNFILMPAIGANVAGQVGSIIAAAMILSIFG